MGYEILTPVVTILDENEKIDYDGNKTVIEYLIGNGVNGIVPLGSTGEFTTFNIEEKKEFIKFYVKEVKNRVEVLPGTGSMNFEDTVEISNFAVSLGVKGVLVIAPYYYALDQNKMFDYYNALSKRVRGNIYIYNFEARTGHNMYPETVYKLCKENKNIRGMKDSTAFLSHTENVLDKVLNDFSYFETYSGFDDHFIANISSGGKGCIAALSNFIPDIWSKWIASANAGDFKKMSEINKLIVSLMKLYNLDSNFTYLFKKLMKLRGLNISTRAIFPYNSIEEHLYDFAVNLLKNVCKDYVKI